MRPGATGADQTAARRPARRDGTRVCRHPVRGRITFRVNSPESSPAAATLAEAAKALAAVAFAGRSSDAALARASTPATQRSAVHAVTLGSLRWYWRLDAIAATLIAGKPLAPALRALLLVALHQLEYARTAPEM